MADIGDLSYDELQRLCYDPLSKMDDMAAKSLCDKAAKEPSILPQLFDDLLAEKLPLRVLEEMITLPVNNLRLVKNQLIALMHSSVAAVRENILRSMAVRWIEVDEAIEIASHALHDASLDVREQAVRTLRTLDQ